MDWKCCSSSERVGIFIFQPSFFPISVDRIGLAVCFRSQFSPCPSSLSLDVTFFHLFFQIQRILKQGNSSDTKSTSPLALTTSLQLAECNTALDCQRKPSHLKTQRNMPLSRQKPFLCTNTLILTFICFNSLLSLKWYCAFFLIVSFWVSSVHMFSVLVFYF